MFHRWSLMETYEKPVQKVLMERRYNTGVIRVTPFYRNSFHRLLSPLVSYFPVEVPGSYIYR